MGSAGKRAFERRKSEKPQVHRYLPATIYQATTKAKAQAHRDPHSRGKSMGTTAAAPSSACAQSPRPLNTGRRERAEGNGEKPKTLTGCLRGGAKADIGALEMPARYGPPAALRCALGCGFSALGFDVAAEGLACGSAPRFLNFPSFGGLFDPPFSVFGDLKLKLRVWRPQERGAPGLRGVLGGQGSPWRCATLSSLPSSVRAS